MKLKTYLLLLFFVQIISCDNATYPPVTLTKFKFTISGNQKGTLNQLEGTAQIECKGNKIILFFEESIENRTDKSDLLVGELILGFRQSDSIGTFALNGISSSENEGSVGIVAFLDKLEFDDLAAQYISNQERYEEVEAGSIIISEWSTQIRGVIRGKLDVNLENSEGKVNIKGDFSVKLDETNVNCPQQSNTL